ncbi:MAG: hypothetical protein LDL41_21225 [Coleofasciculus sp. S288]|nr:hypothetical protein [Coleofasciculus sp. S288]
MQPSQLLLAPLLLMVYSLSAQADSENLPIGVSPSSVSSSQPSIVVPEEEEIAPDMIEIEVQLDPLDSPHPIPWNWVLATHAEVSASESSGSRYYRSQSLISPDGQYAAYSRIQMQGQPELYQSRVTSVMFLENLHTGDLRTITAASPLADNPLVSNEEADMPGTIAILIPVSWSESGERLLARQFEGMFSSSDASDYAVVWDRKQNRTSTITPEKIEYTNAVLLGWSQTNPDRVLFRAGTLGDENWPVWAVDTTGQTTLAIEDEPLIYGQVVNQVWAGPQARW